MQKKVGERVDLDLFLVATACKHLEPLMPTVGRGMIDANAASCVKPEAGAHAFVVHSSVYTSTWTVWRTLGRGGHAADSGNSRAYLTAGPVWALFVLCRLSADH